MHTSFSRLWSACLLLLFTATFSGCLKDECRNQYTIYRPVYESLGNLRSQVKWEPARKIENPGKIYLYGKYLLLNETGKGIHVIDNGTPASPRKMGFLPIPGNVDMAVRNDVLYADSYADLAVIPIRNWTAAAPVTFRDRVFADRNNYWGTQTNPANVQVIVGFSAKDTVVDCETATTWNNCPNCMVADAGGRAVFSNFSAAQATVTGTGGSMARFTLVNDYLYTVTNTALGTFSLTDALNPQFMGNQNLGWGIETIYPFRDKLFIGSTTGMFIFDLANPSSPARLGSFSHARSCDPVIADDQTAFVTLRSGGTMCGGTLNQLNIVDVTNLQTPWLIKSMPLTNPHGLSKDGNLLFVCDGAAGLRVYDATHDRDPRLLQTIGNMGVTYDVIAGQQHMLVVSDKGIYQYNYSDRNNIRLLSKITL